MTKYTMYGTCSQLGVQAAQLAAAGFTAPPEGILDGPRGLWRVLGAIRSDWDELDQQLGEALVGRMDLLQAVPPLLPVQLDRHRSGGGAAGSP